MNIVIFEIYVYYLWECMAYKLLLCITLLCTSLCHHLKISKKSKTFSVKKKREPLVKNGMMTVVISSLTILFIDLKQRKIGFNHNYQTPSVTLF